MKSRALVSGENNIDNKLDITRFFVRRSSVTVVQWRAFCTDLLLLQTLTYTTACCEMLSYVINM